MVQRLLLILVFLNTTSVYAAVNDNDVLSPDGKYIIRSGVDNPYGICCGIDVLESATKRVLHTEQYNGYHDDISYDELIWSPNNKYLAILSRPSKRYISLNILRLSEMRVDEIAIGTAILLANISGRQGKTFNGHRAAIIKDFSWDSIEQNKLSFIISGMIDLNREGNSTGYSYTIKAQIQNNYLQINEMVMNNPSN
jgi:WD40 repeat protein